MKTGSFRARDGAQLRVRAIGKGEPVVLLHGLGASGHQWLPFIWPQLHRFRFYIPDLRAMGASASIAYNQPDIFQNHMEDLQDLIAHFDLDQFVLGGHSLGNSISLHWLSRDRDNFVAKVKRYLHVDQSPCIKNSDTWRYGTFGDDQSEVFAGLRRFRELIIQHTNCGTVDDLPSEARTEAVEALTEIFSRMTGSSQWLPILRPLATRSSVLINRLPLQRLPDLERLINSYLNAHDYRESLRGCPTPMTLFIGMQSTLYDSRGQMAIVDLADKARVVRFERSGHLPQASQPIRFAREFSRFLHGT